MRAQVLCAIHVELADLLQLAHFIAPTAQQAVQIPTRIPVLRVPRVIQVPSHHGMF